MKADNFSDLNEKLIKHYYCFNTERFYLDEFNKKDKFISIVSSVYDTCPYKLCRNIAKFIKKNIQEPEIYPFIYVSAYFFKTTEL